MRFEGLLILLNSVYRFSPRQNRAVRHTLNFAASEAASVNFSEMRSWQVLHEVH
jgi:hypothetical protein